MPLPQRLVQWFAVPMFLSAGVLLPPPPIAVAQIERQPAEVILRVEGALGPDSPTLTSDDTPYAIHTFEGQAGQTVTLIMESLVLDAYLFLNGPDGQKLAENDDFETGNYNAVITLTLPVDGTYSVMANAYKTEGGTYTLTVLAGDEPVFSEVALQQVEARRLNRQAMDLSDVGEYEAALELLNQALLLWREVGDRRGEAISLNNVGLVHHNLSRSVEALEAYNQALVIQQEIGDRYNEATSLNNIGSIYYRLGDYPKALELYQASLSIRQDIGDKHGQAFSLNSIGLVSQEQSRYVEALEYYRQALELFKNANDIAGQATVSNNMATVYEAQGDYPKALEIYQQNLQIRRGSNNRNGEATDLNNIAGIYTQMSDYRQALNYYQQGLVIQQEIGDRQGIAISLNNIGKVYLNLGDYPEALDYFQQALNIYIDIGDRHGEAVALSNLGTFHYYISDYPQALDYFQQALEIYQMLDNRTEMATTLSNISSVHSDLGDYDLGISFNEQALDIRRAIGDRPGEAFSLNNIGVAYADRGDYPRALENYQQALLIFQALGNRSGEAGVFHNIGAAYEKLTDYSQALNFYEQSLAIWRDISDRSGEATALGSIGAAYDTLGNYTEALSYYQQALAIRQDIGDRRGEAGSLNAIAVTYLQLKDYSLSLDYLQQALVIAEAINDRPSAGGAWANIGSIYREQGNHSEALDAYQRALPIIQEVGNRYGEGVILSALGETYRRIGDYPQALDYHQQALAVLESLGARDRSSATLRNLGRTLADQGQTELAIVFYKRSINLTEAIRGEIQGLEQGLQQTYTDSIAEGYRELADLLLNQGRIPEAQQVLDLLQLEEVREFTNTRALWTGSSLAYSDIEQSIVESHGDLIAFGQTFYECQQTNCDRLDELSAQRTRLNEQYNAQVATFREQVRQNRSQDEAFLEPDRLGSSARNLLQAHPNSVLIYPFVTEDKLWLLWASAGAYGTIKQEVSQEQLARAVQRFGELLTTGGNVSELQAVSQQLYGWLVEPLEESLQANDIEKLIFVNDRVTRYIPMAALFDGEQYLLERYTLSTVISPAITDTTRRLGNVDEAPVLGLGLTQPIDGFAPLPAVREALTQIVKSLDSSGIFPGNIFLDDAFTLQNLERNLLNHRVLHIATHAEFVPGRPGESYILLGDGDRLDVNAINAREHLLENLHMVVLSACQTALGGPSGDGSEIAGISSYFLDEGRAQTVVASLWKVNDGSTSLLMQRFYELLATGELTKAEALRQAQLSLLYNEDAETRLAAVRADVGYVTRNQNSSTPSAQHPYHWAPFILIGNGL